jgi:hypothetical protein
MMWGEESSSKSESSGDNEEDEEGKIISSPCSPHPQSLTLPSDLFGQQIRVPASACLVKHPRWIPVGSLAYRRGLVSRWYALSCRECMLTSPPCG